MTPPRDKPNPARRDRILEVARKHFERFGYRRAVLDDIAAEAGCAKGSLYLEFASKEELFFAVFDALRAEAGQRFAAATAGAATPSAWLRATLTLTFETLEREPLMARLLADDPELQIVRSYLARGGVQAETDAALAHLRGLLRQGIDAGEFRPDLDLEVLPFVFAGLKFLHLHADLITAGRIERRRLFAGLVELAMAAVAARPPGPPQGAA